MNFKMIHENCNVFDLQKSIAFYEKALGLTEKRRKEAPDGSFIIVYLGSTQSDFELELTWMRDMKRPYELGDCEFHLAFHVEDVEAAVAELEKCGIECEPIRYDDYTNKKMTFFFDPDGLPLELHE